MDSNVMPSIVKIDRENLTKLVSEVKETVATGHNNEPSAVSQKKFSVVDLWKIQGTMRTGRTNSRFFLQ